MLIETLLDIVSATKIPVVGGNVDAKAGIVDLTSTALPADPLASFLAVLDLDGEILPSEDTEKSFLEQTEQAVVLNADELLTEGTTSCPIAGAQPAAEQSSLAFPAAIPGIPVADAAAMPVIALGPDQTPEQRSIGVRHANDPVVPAKARNQIPMNDDIVLAADETVDSRNTEAENIGRMPEPPAAPHLKSKEFAMPASGNFHEFKPAAPAATSTLYSQIVVLSNVSVEGMGATHGTGDLGKMEVLRFSPTSIASVSEQISRHAKDGDIATFEIRLDPPELGKLKINLEFVGNSLVAVIAAERPETAELMRRASDALQSEFASLGYDDIELDFRSDQEFSRQSENAALDRKTFELAENLQPGISGEPSLGPLPRSGNTGLDVRI